MRLKICTPQYRKAPPPAGVEKIVCAWEARVGPNIWRNRNELMSLDSQYTHFLQWDQDIEANAYQIQALLAHDVDIVSGAYLQRRSDGETSYCAGRDGRSIGINSRGCFPVEWVGAGFLLISRHALESLDRPWFRHEMMDGDHTSEDVGFCMHARANGFAVYLDCDTIVKHHL